MTLKREITIKVTLDQKALITALLAGDMKTFTDQADKIIADTEAEAKMRKLAAMPFKKWHVTRNLDAYVVHEAFVEARTEQEAAQILHTKCDALFDLEIEGEIKTFDDVEYIVEGLAD